MTTDAVTPRSSVSLLRRILVILIIVSFGLAALGGIIVLLGGDLGDAAGRVLGTTAIVGAFSVAVLCCAALLGRRARVFGIIGAVVSIITAVFIVFWIWSDVPWGPVWEAFLKWTWTGVAATAAFSLASLLLLLADRRRQAVRVGLWITLALFAVLLVLVVYAVWGEPDYDDYARVTGIVAILAALGAVVVPVLSLLMPDTAKDAASALPPELTERLVAEAARRGVTVDELVAPLFTPEPSQGP